MRSKKNHHEFPVKWDMLNLSSPFLIKYCHPIFNLNAINGKVPRIFHFEEDLVNNHYKHLSNLIFALLFIKRDESVLKLN